MNKFLWVASLLLLTAFTQAQTTTTAVTNASVVSTEVLNILKGSFTPTTYLAAGPNTNPSTVSAGLLQSISPDSLKSSLIALAGFQNRNSGADTVSKIRGIGAARRWVFNKLQQYSAASANRLRPSYFQFTQTICSKTSHRNVIAVLPGTQVTDKRVLLLEAHLDSRCENECDISCNAFGADDDASGVALVLELARVLSQYSFKHTIVFSINTGEEQGLYGATAFADYCKTLGIKFMAVNNNDVSGGIFCGHTSSAPSCPAYGDIDSVNLRIFSLGGFNSPHKQWARYVKLQYQEQLASLVPQPTDIEIMTPEDRTGRGGDHQPFRADGYTAVRFTEANEDGDANITASYTDREHSVRDSLGMDTDNDGIIDTFYVNTSYLARNTLVNGNAIAMAALSPDTAVLTTKALTGNKLIVTLRSSVTQPGYRVAVRSATNDWDSVYTLTKPTDTISVPYGSRINYFISAASVDINHLESLFGKETSLTTGTITTTTSYLASASVAAEEQPELPGYEGIHLLQNRPNPVDEATTITIVAGTDAYADRTWLQITTIDGRVVQRTKIPLKTGVNEVLYNHGYAAKGIYIYSLIIDGLAIQSKKMVFAGH